MIIVLIGPSGSGKSTIENELSKTYGYSKIVSYTTRKPRNNEKNGKDYWFVPNETFKETLDRGLFAEYEEYSEQRFYGTLISDYSDGDKVVVLTPNELRQLKKFVNMDNIITVLVNANLGTRIKRYIDRCGCDNFTYTDKEEIASRVDRDFGMFLGADKEVDLIVENNENTKINDVVQQIIEYVKEEK